MTPDAACRCKSAALGIFVGEPGLERDIFVADMKGFETSKGPVDMVDLDLDLFFVGEDASETPFMPDITDGVRGVLASERVRCRLGVFGSVCIVMLCSS